MLLLNAAIWCQFSLIKKSKKITNFRLLAFRHRRWWHNRRLKFYRVPLWKKNCVSSIRITVQSFVISSIGYYRYDLQKCLKNLLPVIKWPIYEDCHLCNSGIGIGILFKFEGRVNLKLPIPLYIRILSKLLFTE